MSFHVFIGNSFRHCVFFVLFFFLVLVFTFLYLTLEKIDTLQCSPTKSLESKRNNLTFMNDGC